MSSAQPSRADCAKRLEHVIAYCNQLLKQLQPVELLGWGSSLFHYELSGLKDAGPWLQLHVPAVINQCRAWSPTALSYVDSVSSLRFSINIDIPDSDGLLSTGIFLPGKKNRTTSAQMPNGDTLRAVLPVLFQIRQEVESAGSKRGPRPRDHKAVADVVGKYGGKWQNHLIEICEELDNLEVEPPTARGADDILTRSSWLDFLNEHNGKLGVKKSLNESLKKFPK